MQWLDDGAWPRYSLRKSTLRPLNLTQPCSTNPHTDKLEDLSRRQLPVKNAKEVSKENLTWGFAGSQIPGVDVQAQMTMYSSTGRHGVLPDLDNPSSSRCITPDTLARLALLQHAGSRTATPAQWTGAYRDTSRTPTPAAWTGVYASGGLDEGDIGGSQLGDVEIELPPELPLEQPRQQPRCAQRQSRRDSVARQRGCEQKFQQAQQANVIKLERTFSWDSIDVVAESKYSMHPDDGDEHQQRRVASDSDPSLHKGLTKIARVHSWLWKH